MSDAIHIVIVGAGGLGIPAAWGIASAWPNNRPCSVRIIDPDTIELSNLNRQVFYSADELGEPKADVLSRKLQSLASGENTALGFEPLCEALTLDNCDTILGDAAYVIDATDSPPAKFLINDYCHRRGISFCYGGVSGENGLVLSVPPSGACLRCLFGDFSEDDFNTQNATCQHSGVWGAVPGYVGFLQASQALEFFLREKRPTSSRLFRISLSKLLTEERTLPPDTSCPLGCSKISTKQLDLLDKTCPSTFLFTKLAMEELPKGELLEVHLSSQESARNVARSIEESGYRVVDQNTDSAREAWTVLIQKPQD